MSDYISHHGIKGQRWGVRRYQNPDGSLTAAGEKRYLGQVEKRRKNESKKIDSEIKQAEKNIAWARRNSARLSAKETQTRAEVEKQKAYNEYVKSERKRTNDLYTKKSVYDKQTASSIAKERENVERRRAAAKQILATAAVAGLTVYAVKNRRSIVNNLNKIVTKEGAKSIIKSAKEGVKSARDSKVVKSLASARKTLAKDSRKRVVNIIGNVLDKGGEVVEKAAGQAVSNLTTAALVSSGAYAAIEASKKKNAIDIAMIDEEYEY